MNSLKLRTFNRDWSGIVLWVRVGLCVYEYRVLLVCLFIFWVDCMISWMTAWLYCMYVRSSYKWRSATKSKSKIMRRWPTNHSSPYKTIINRSESIKHTIESVTSWFQSVQLSVQLSSAQFSFKPELNAVPDRIFKSHQQHQSNDFLTVVPPLLPIATRIGFRYW